MDVLKINDDDDDDDDDECIYTVLCLQNIANNCSSTPAVQDTAWLISLVPPPATLIIIVNIVYIRNCFHSIIIRCKQDSVYFKLQWPYVTDKTGEN